MNQSLAQAASAQSLPDQVAKLILQRIATGELAAGHRLPSQRELAQSMGVGLAVIREAVKRLEALNIVEATHGSGTVVRPFRWMPLLYDPSLFQLAVKRIGVRDLWEARRLLEGQIDPPRGRARDRGQSRADARRARPRQSAARATTASQALNREFHLAIAQGRRRTRCWRICWRRCSTCRFDGHLRIVSAPTIAAGHGQAHRGDLRRRSPRTMSPRPSSAIERAFQGRTDRGRTRSTARGASPSADTAPRPRQVGR